MVKRLVQLQDKAGMLASPGLATAPVLAILPFPGIDQRQAIRDLAPNP